ncbi:CocE/NonD family hydrolase [Micromonospora yangpuensis]|uniref:X-Pro dipeptidyl-peptidase n=1 Tax=Micromonospora yangpuensis TaxID=683228 RepID=A0A1C6UNB2_9ACTN|nr:CocE/NonD family hydrolase [Micromonospora yangpuensis]GGM09468.1 X-Pro dipeptidyl-peptidase [Micromonospora yangpuensis]SCL55482.1 X-Pro dipeptidyl-peptidase [Micromonospora yangpuensis]
MAVTGRPWRGGIAVLAATALAVLAASPQAVAADEPPTIVVSDGVTQPVFGYSDAIRERLFIDSTFDSDNDGLRDIIAFDVMRPKATADGLKVPVVMDASPYYTTLCRGNDSECKVDLDGDGLLDKWPLWYDNYFVPRGYAVILLDMVGTGNSTGCPTTNANQDNLSAKQAINWLNGRATARNAAGEVVKADWHNGKSGMIGKSYDGSLAMATAVTGVQGLTTIVPIGGPSEYYDYVRSNGVVTRGNSYVSYLANVVTNPERRDYCKPVRDALGAADGDEHGDYTAFWNERSYVKKVPKQSASVLLYHGINDDNVRADHMSKYWYALAENDIPRKLWISQEGHVDPFDSRRAVWVDTLHRWFDFWLQGVANGIMDEPRLDIERAADVWETHADWPIPGKVDTEVFLQPATSGAGGLGLVPTAKPATGRFQDSRTQSQNTMINNPGVVQPHRLAFLSEPLTAPLHISGTPTMQIRASADQTDTNFGVILVDYGTDERVAHRASGEGIITLDTQDCWGESSATDDACYRQTVKRVATADTELVTKGIMDAQNRQSIRVAVPLVPGESYNFSWPLLPEDYVFKPGHRIGVIVVASYPQYSSQADTTAANIAVNLKSSKIVLPVVGGTAAAHAAGL